MVSICSRYANCVEDFGDELNGGRTRRKFEIPKTTWTPFAPSRLAIGDKSSACGGGRRKEGRSWVIEE